MSSLTKLQAVNYVLTVTGSLPVADLDTSGNSAASMVERTIDDETIAALDEGFHFNTRNNVEIAPDGSNYINAPASAIRIDTDAEDANTDGVQVGGRLYDRENNTFEWDDSLKTEQVLNIDWGCIPYPIRRYITTKAAVVFARSYGNMIEPSKMVRLEREHELWRIKARKYDSDVADVNLLRTPDSIYVSGNRYGASYRDAW